MRTYDYSLMIDDIVPVQKVAWSSQTLTVGTLSDKTEVHRYPWNQEPLSYVKQNSYFNVT